MVTQGTQSRSRVDSVSNMDHSRVSFEVIDPSWPVVETKVAPWGGDDHTIN
jgi:hypothetical protein